MNLTKGTRILDISLEPDEKVIRWLKRKYGKDLLSPDARLWKILPRNKQLTLRELVALTRYQYQRTWGDGAWWSREHGTCHYESLCRCMSMLRLYKYDGMGDLTGDVGILLFSPERILVKELVVVADGVLGKYHRYSDDYQFQSVEEARGLFQKYGSAEHKALVERCNRYVSGEPAISSGTQFDFRSDSAGKTASELLSDDEDETDNYDWLK